ncbi:MAG: histidine kinase [Candidatus Accumulibacter sp.]|nr:histidine kinase [Accumulibacter sp.]
MIREAGAGAPQILPIHWKSLRYFSVYRLCIAALLAASAFYPIPLLSLIGQHASFLKVVVCFYLVANVAALATLHVYQRHFNRQLSIQVLLDILILAWLAYNTYGVRDSLGVMLLVTLIGASLVGEGRLALFYAAMATLAVLGDEWLLFVKNAGETDVFLSAGLFCASFFIIAIFARLLAKRIIANEELARKRGEALRNQTIISQRVIEEMQDGVLVLGHEGVIKQHNPRIEHLLGLGDPKERQLSSYSTELSVAFRNWCARGGDESVLVRAPASGAQLRARFIATQSSDGDVLILLEDLGRLREHARQLKLVALGRLTANIAHEIRNPLSAIKHAGELLREEATGPTSERLLRIVLDNTRRVERIVADVLELGRRDRTRRELVDLRQALPVFVEEFALKESVPESVVQLDISGRACMTFDRSHLNQILWNLADNALRHSRRETGSIRLRVQDDERDRVDLHVIDDGEGIGEENREQIFEPFFTTHSRGTGLGLHIARELCEANGAYLTLRDSRTGADFCISGRSVP